MNARIQWLGEAFSLTIGLHQDMACPHKFHPVLPTAWE